MPALFPGQPMEQVLAMSVTLVVFSGLQARFWPWRTEVANYADLGINFGLVLMITGAAFLVEVDAAYGGVVLADFLLCCVVLVFLVVLIVVSHSAYRRLVPAYTYGIFLCHHKGGAAVLSRYFKTKAARLTAISMAPHRDSL